MRTPKSPHFRFLLRASSLVIAMLALWWWVLLAPMLTGLRLSTELVFRMFAGEGTVTQITENADGDWLMQVPLPRFVANSDSVQKMFRGSAPAGPPVRIRSLKLAAPRLSPSLFALPFPLYWAILLAAGWRRDIWRPMAWGTLVLALMAQCSMILYTIFTVGAKLNLTNGPGGKVLEFFEYMNMYVVPYMAPVLLALIIDEGLRAQVFSLTGEVLPPVEPAPAPQKRAGRKRR